MFVLSTIDVVVHILQKEITKDFFSIQDHCYRTLIRVILTLSALFLAVDNIQ